MNPNDVVEIKPTEGGWLEIAAYVDAFNEHMKVNRPNAMYRMRVPSADSDGYIRDQLWSLMKYFDWTRGYGCDVHFSDLRPIAKNQGAGK